jgi:hypothetical protein
MFSLKTWMLTAAVLAGAAGLGATTAQAAQVRVYVGAVPAAYMPPCPGAGYFWVDGYYDRGYWVAGRWEFRGHVDSYRDDGRGWDREYNRGRNRDFDRGRDRDFDNGRAREGYRH